MISGAGPENAISSVRVGGSGARTTSAAAAAYSSARRAVNSSAETICPAKCTASPLDPPVEEGGDGAAGAAGAAGVSVGVDRAATARATGRERRESMAGREERPEEG